MQKMELRVVFVSFVNKISHEKWFLLPALAQVHAIIISAVRVMECAVC
jgi:hypothetical protein